MMPWAPHPSPPNPTATIDILTLQAETGKFKVRSHRGPSGGVENTMFACDVTFCVHVDLLFLQKKIYEHVSFHHLFRQITLGTKS